MLKQKLRLWLSVFIALALCIVFAIVFVVYSQPMENRSYDLSLSDPHSEIPVDLSAERGWTVFTQQGEERCVLVPDGLGSFAELEFPGQTFYYSRVMTEKIDSPVLQLKTANQNFAIFLDGELIHTDCPELDNRIGYLSLPMREWDRSEELTIALPENYLGKTLTIAQSTPTAEYAERPDRATMVVPSSMTLYCGYAYESGLIAESFLSAVQGGLFFAIGVLLLILFLRRAALEKLDVGLFFLALTVFLFMTACLYDVSYAFKYFGVSPIDVPTTCRLLMAAGLLFFLCTRAEGCCKWLLLALAALDAAGAIVYLTFCAVLFPFGSIMHFLVHQLPELFSVAALMGVLIIGWLRLRKTGQFYRWFVPFATLGALPFLAFAAYWIIISYPNSSLVAMSGYLRHRLSLVMVGVSVLVVTVQFARDELQRFSEKQMMMEMNKMTHHRYENLRLHNEEIMMLQHDMDKHYRYLREIASDDKTAQYLDALIGQIEKVRPVMQSGNEVLDIIIGSRLCLAAEAGVQVEIPRAEAPSQLPLGDVELCSLVMNLMDNAVDAAKSSDAEQPYIRLDLHVKNGFFVFVLENTANMKAVRAEKAETVPKHGLGLKIVRQIAEKHGYLIQTEYGEDYYKVHLAIQLSK